MPTFRKRTILLLPAVLLTVNLLEYVAMYKARQHVRDVHIRAAIALVLYGVAFAVSAEAITPWLSRVLTATRRGSHRHAGTMGLLLFYALMYGGLYWAYLRLEVHGVVGLLPASMR
jgi:hypothetical protein